MPEMEGTEATENICRLFIKDKQIYKDRMGTEEGY